MPISGLKRTNGPLTEVSDRFGVSTWMLDSEELAAPGGGYVAKRYIA